MSGISQSAVIFQLTFPPHIGISTTVTINLITYTFKSTSGNERKSNLTAGNHTLGHFHKIPWYLKLSVSK